MSTTTINFTMKNLDGTVVPYTQFQIDSGRLNTGEIPDVMPASLTFTTDANGQASVVMTVTEAPYYLSKLDGSTDKVISYKFFVPASDVSLDAELLYVDLGKTSKFYNDKSVAALIEAKIVAVNAANRALQVVTTLGSLDTLRTNLGSIISVGTNIASVNTVATNIASVNAVNAASTTISAVNAALTNINAVGSSIASVDTVASNIGNVSTVVGMSSNIASVVANATDIDTVANNMTDVQAAASALPGLTSATIIAPYVTQITNVSNNITSVNAVGSNIANINDVAGMEADIEALADNLDNLAAAAAAVTQAVDAQKQLFLVGVDYTLGVSTALALTYVPAKSNAVKVFFDGEYQTKDTYSVVHHTITFNAAITASKVEVQYDVPSSFVGLTPTDLVTLQTAETNASNSASASAVSAAAALASEVDAQQSASAAAVSASSMQQATDAVKELFVSGIDYTINTSTTLTLANAPAKSNSVLVFFNGTYKHASTWNRVGASIIFNSPINVALVEVWYQVPSLLVALTPAEDLILTNAVNASQASADAAALSETAAEAAAVAVAAAVDGVKDLYVAGTHYTKNVSTSVTLSAVPAKPNTVKVFFNGVYQNKDTYYLVGSTINFGVVGTPAVIDSDSVEVQYEIPSQFVGLSVGEQAVLTAAQSNALASANAAAGSAVDAEASANAMKISDYAALRTYSGTQTSVYVTTSGIAGHFIYDGLTAGVAEDNGGTVICAASVGAKRWKRVFDGAVSVKWFGAVSDGLTISAAAIQSAVDFTSVALNAGVFSTEASLLYRKDQTIKGSGKSFLGTTIKPTGNFPALGNKVEVPAIDNGKNAISGLLIDAVNITSDYAMKVQNTYTSVFDEIWIRNSWKGVYVAQSDSVTFNGLMVMENSNNDAVLIGDYARSIRFNYSNFEKSPGNANPGGVVRVNGTGSAVSSAYFYGCQIERGGLIVERGLVKWYGGKAVDATVSFLNRSRDCYYSATNFGSTYINDIGMNTIVESAYCLNMDTPRHEWPVLNPSAPGAPTFGGAGDEYLYLVSAGTRLSTAVTGASIAIKEGAATLATSPLFDLSAQGVTVGNPAKDSYTFVAGVRNSTGPSGPTFTGCSSLGIRGGKNLLTNGTFDLGSSTGWTLTNCAGAASGDDLLVTPSSGAWNVGQGVTTVLVHGKRYIAMAKHNGTNSQLVLGNANSGTVGSRPVYSGSPIINPYGDGYNLSMISFEFTGQWGTLSFGALSNSSPVALQWIMLIAC